MRTRLTFPTALFGCVLLLSLGDAARAQTTGDSHPWLALSPARLAVTAAQAGRGVITGRVTVNGAPPPGPMTVIVTNVDTGVDRRTNTSADGTYLFGGLAPGRYRIRMEEAGMRPFASAEMAIAAGDRRTQDVALEPAAAASPAPAAAPATPAPAPAAPPSPSAARPAPPAEPVAAAPEARTRETRAADEEDESRITNEYIPLQLATFPKRPKPLVELGTPFLGTGNIGQGFKIPTGAVWLPSFLAFGTLRTGAIGFKNFNATDAEVTTTQWANRLDFFGNLYLTQTERVVFGLRPIDETDATGARLFSGYTRTKTPAGITRTTNNQFNFEWKTVSHLFFEGDFGELFPGLDPKDTRALDYGFSVGRQPISFQEGVLINDFIDAVGITRNNLTAPGLVNLRITGLFGWNQINRNTPSGNALLRNSEADASRLIGVFTQIDSRAVTIDVDAAFVIGGDFVGANGVKVKAGNGAYVGVALVGRPGGGGKNLALRVLTSQPLGDRTPANTLFSDPATRGVLAMSEFSWTPKGGENFIYINSFAAYKDYRAAALDPTVPGPLARVGVLFAGSGLGNAPSALPSTASNAVGTSVGYQIFSGSTRRQLLLEAGGRYSTADCAGPTVACDPHGFAGSAAFQAAAGRHFILVLDAYVARDQLRGVSAARFGADSRTRTGVRLEWLTNF
jgi:carboxypeptidase family protein